MGRQKIIVVYGVIVLFSLVGLMLANPTLGDYRRVILEPRAIQIAEHWAEADRRTIERVAAQAEVAYTNHRTDTPNLTALSLLKTIPHLQSYLDNSKETAGQGFPERLAMWKHQALLRVSAAHDDTKQGILADLTFHTTRTSYGLGAILSTCYEGKATRYLAVAARFIDLAQEECLADRMK
ncbi:MAG: hypothetical protein HY581_07525 [Nitrospirae bacterium]|nr:hypothetical protein [Nitrospirota bacterium]